MKATRRAVLTTGSAFIVIAAAGAAGWALTRAPRAARAPWRAAAEESFGDPRLDALAYAILAPNPHNMQPWRVRLDGDDAFTLFCDRDRLLPETDPANRQITIGFGCFLELLRQAAAEKGYRADFSYFPEGEPWPGLDERPIAAARLARDDLVMRDPLFGGALSRRTSRAPFDLNRSVDDVILKNIVEASVAGIEAAATGETARVAELCDLTANAWSIEWANAPTRRESINLTRIGKREINETPWGLSLAGPLLEALGAGPFSRENMDVEGSMAFEQSQSFYERACRSATAFVWSTTASNTRRDQLESGRAWVRMHLAANAAGVSFHPLSQALQEYPAMSALYGKAHALLAGGDGRTVQMLARLGYAKSPPPSPREDLAAKLIRL
jgi:hypothetical protein